MFVLIDENSDSDLHFNQGGEVVVFDQTHSLELFSRKVIISNMTKIYWYGVFSGNNNYNLQFETQSGESIIRILLLTTNNEKLNTTVHSTLSHSHTTTNIHILSLVGEAGVIILNGTVQIDPDVSQVK